MRMKRWISLCLAVCLVFVAAVALGETESEKKQRGDWTYVVQEDGTACITAWAGSDQDLMIPDTLDDLAVTAIGRRAFSFCESLTSITIPESVTSIGNLAFSLCDSLTALIVSPGSYAEQYAQSNALPYAYPEADTSWLNN